MLTLGSISFAAPWALLGLAALPVLCWLLRLTPPAPWRMSFPPVRLLLELTSVEESPAKSPLWLLILRLCLATALIVGAAHPLFNAQQGMSGSGPLILIIDDGWASAANWPGRRQAAGALIDRAEREERRVVIVTTAPEPAAEPGEESALPPKGQALAPAQARRLLQGLLPKPWPTDRMAALAPLLDEERTARSKSGPQPGQVVWLSDGLEETGEGGEFAQVVEALKSLVAVSVIEDRPHRRAMILRPPEAEGDALIIGAVRPDTKGERTAAVRAMSADGRLLGRETLRFADGGNLAETRMVLPAELRNRLARFEIEDERTAGAVVLVDERWRRRPVGLLVQEGAADDQPLLSAHYYLARALEPYTEVRRGAIGDLLGRELAVLMLADPPPLEEKDRRAMEQWIDGGGVVVRFAGPRLAKTADALLPVELQGGDRSLGGAMSWDKPVSLAPFEESSPFHGLDVSGTASGDIRIRRQVLAKPSLGLAEKTWARLNDGTPLITAEQRNKGWLVLVHTTANTNWSDLPLSGLFVEMLRRIVALSQGAVAKPGGPPLPPLETLDGFGRLGPAPADALAIASDDFGETRVEPRHPPGYYGDSLARQALNLSAGLSDPRAVGALPGGVARQAYGKVVEVDFRPWLLGAALVMFILDLIASLALRGLLRPLHRPLNRLAPAMALSLLVMAAAPDGFAQEDPFPQDDTLAMSASLNTRLAYIITGNTEVDGISRAGLAGLSVIVNRRTAAELAEPFGIDPEIDAFNFFPLLYWPVTGEQRPLSARAVGRVNAYLAGGGTILFDTRQQGDIGGGDGARLLQRLVAGLDVPPLNPISPSHVLNRSYYLLNDLPGRWTGSTIWVELPGERVNDGVSPVIVGGNDWAAAWAMDEAQRYLFPVVPGGERQREIAYRFGINLVMYTLTGNYKSDQVHLPEILRRLGQ